MVKSERAEKVIYLTNAKKKELHGKPVKWAYTPIVRNPVTGCGERRILSVVVDNT